MDKPNVPSSKTTPKSPSPQAFAILAKMAAAKRERLKVESAKTS